MQVGTPVQIRIANPETHDDRVINNQYGTVEDGVRFGAGEGWTAVRLLRGAVVKAKSTDVYPGKPSEGTK